jgi:hypothetical protein
MEEIKFKELDKLNEILVKYSKEERKVLLESIDEDLEKSYTHLKKNGWTITTNGKNPIYGLHREKSE